MAFDITVSLIIFISINIEMDFEPFIDFLEYIGEPVTIGELENPALYDHARTTEEIHELLPHVLRLITKSSTATSHRLPKKMATRVKKLKVIYDASTAAEQKEIREFFQSIIDDTAPIGGYLKRARKQRTKKRKTRFNRSKKN